MIATPPAGWRERADRAVARAALVVRNDRGDGLDDADQRKEHGDVDAAADRHRRQIFGAVVPEQDSVDDHHAH